MYQVSSTKPLAFAGNIIDNFTLTFENGRIVDYKAEVGEEALKHLVETRFSLLRRSSFSTS